MIRLAFISDTHCQHRNVAVPSCDVLVHCGDATGIGEIDRLRDFNAWCRQLKRAGVCREVVFVAGNYDLTLDVTHPKVEPRRHAAARESLQDLVYLQDEAATVCGVKFYGSPWTPRFFDWGFQLGYEAARHHWLIPQCDVLVTHGPPFGMLDLCDDGRRVGCRALTETLTDINTLARAAKKAGDAPCRVPPSIHAFGHIHHSYGVVGCLRTGTRYVNASTCTEAYKPTNRPIVVDLGDA